jgi:hypothetical protein
MNTITVMNPRGQFAAVSPDGKTEYEIPPVLYQPQPQLIGSIFSPGESHDGWILLQVPEKDKKPLLIFKRQNIEGVHGVWDLSGFSFPPLLEPLGPHGLSAPKIRFIVDPTDLRD